MPRLALGSHVNALAQHWRIKRPSGAGPFPIVMMMHGCGGPRPFIEDMAQVAANAGAAALVIDSFAPRRISRMAAFATVCTGARLQGRERAGDLYAAIAWARTQSWVNANKIAAMGWSHGGWTILDALALRSGAEMARATGIPDLPREPLEGLRHAMLVYPYTGVGSLVGQRPWRINPRGTAIIAQYDFIVGQSRAALEHQRGRGSPLEIVHFENTTHAFEDPEAEDPRVRYNPTATAREHDLLRKMITGL